MDTAGCSSWSPARIAWLLYPLTGLGSAQALLGRRRGEAMGCPAGTPSHHRARSQLVMSGVWGQSGGAAGAAAWAGWRDLQLAAHRGGARWPGRPPTGRRERGHMDRDRGQEGRERTGRPSTEPLSPPVAKEAPLHARSGAMACTGANPQCSGHHSSLVVLTSLAATSPSPADLLRRSL